ncbi:hypothetical protein KC717_00590 [Candidatus Dojkabacteria bacterium]|uniref:Uncharacterized protein n=1 Tax=Candidatus Dojkabacteria bacterium TaxID=2099670 RepID=A0A955L7I2_9BACT|nr:hypothetical protein [Candidatus Dojkabacteria bacterium]
MTKKKAKKFVLDKKVGAILVIILITVGTVIAVNLDNINYYFRPRRSGTGRTEASYQKGEILLEEKDLLQGLNRSDIEALTSFNYELDSEGYVASVYLGQPTKQDFKLHSDVYNRIMFNIYGRDYLDVGAEIFSTTYERGTSTEPIFINVGSTTIEYINGTTSTGISEIEISL